MVIRIQTVLVDILLIRDAVQKKNGKKSDIVTKGGGGYGKNHLSYSFERVTKVVRGGVHGICHSFKCSPLCLKIIKEPRMNCKGELKNNKFN